MSRCLPLCLLPFLLSFATALSLGAQTGLGPAPTVGEIAIEYRGPRNVSEDAVRVHIQQRVDAPYDQLLVDRSIRSLYATGFFDFIEVRTEDLPGQGTVRVVFTVEPKYRLKTIVFDGNDAFSRKRLLDKIESVEGGSLNERRINSDNRALFEYYQEKGFPNIRVDYVIDRDEQSGLGTVTFVIEEGEKVRVDEIYFEGNEAFSDGRLRKVMATKEYSFLSWLTGTGRFKDNEFVEDINKLEAYYRNEGYLDVEIDEDAITFDYPDESKLQITIPLSEGRQYQTGEVSFEGNELFTDEQLMSILKLQPGRRFSPGELDEDTETVRDVYGSRGYLETRVRPERVPNMQTGRIDIVYRIRESEQFRVESVVVEGNTKTKSVVILRELALTPGQTFDLVRMKASQARLENTQFFESVDLTPESTNIPGRKNLKVAVSEGRTGEVTFGAGFSSLEDAVVFVELKQSNFDLFNWRSFFQGDGQKLRILLQLGSESSQFVLAFEEPWLFEQRLRFGFELFRRETDFVSNRYDELRQGFEIYFARRLFELVHGRLAYRFENVEIEDITPTSQELIDEEGERTVSRLSLTLTRDTRDRLLFSTSGNRLSVTASLAGTALGGDTDYLLLEARGVQFFPTFDWPVPQNIALLGRIGSIFDTDNEYIDNGIVTQQYLDRVDDIDGAGGIIARNPETGDPYAVGDTRLQRNVPIFDRFYLGGPNSVRGFDYREVGGSDVRAADGEPLGGQAYAFASVEYTFQVTEQFQFAMFYDWGFVNASETDFNPSDFNDSWGVGLRILVLGAPMRLDFAIPITSSTYIDQTRSPGNQLRDNDEGNQFWFTFGTRY